MVFSAIPFAIIELGLAPVAALALLVTRGHSPTLNLLAVILPSDIFACLYTIPLGILRLITPDSLVLAASALDESSGYCYSKLDAWLGPQDPERPLPFTDRVAFFGTRLGFCAASIVDLAIGLFSLLLVPFSSMGQFLEFRRIAFCSLISPTQASCELIRSLTIVLFPRSAQGSLEEAGRAAS